MRCQATEKADSNAARSLRVNLLALRQHALVPLGEAEATQFDRVVPECVHPEHHALARVIVRGGIPDLEDRQIRPAHPAVDRLIFLPEAPRELEADFHRRDVLHLTDRADDIRREVGGDVPEDGQRQRADAIVPRDLARLVACPSW